ncbi:MAG: enhancer of polycomb-like-domain-containing protein [Benjaminiella poitrasii]|nr:MAG: enhancer of polycomb-like-domain-containing protein [Benjaminiella poitrasii]
MTNQMVSRFRVKKLSPKHPLPIYKESQLPDLSDAVNIQRAVPQIETGVEKEEEEEHDLQAAISAAQAAVTTGASVEKYIPTPDASRLIESDKFHALYKKKFKEPSTLIRFSSTVEDSIGCPYFMDEEDEEFLKDYNKQYPGEILSEDLFEKIIWECESIANQQWPHLYLDSNHIPDYETFLDHVPNYSKIKNFPNLPVIYAHWRKRRQAREGKWIMPQLVFEDTLKSEIDPYVCFRRRETKPVRKTRRTDQQSLERLRKLRSEMEMARNLLEMVLRREKIRKESLILEHTVFEKRRSLQEYQRILGIKEDDDLLLSLSKKKRKSSSMETPSGATIKIPLHKLRRDGYLFKAEKSPTQLAIESELARRKELDVPYEDVTECPFQPFPLSTPEQFYQSLSNTTKPHGIKYRKRVGRCGRIFIDRVGYKPMSPPAEERHQGSGGGKTRPPTIDPRYLFDSDVSDEETTMVEEMDNMYLKHRVQLFSETELRHLLTIPFLTPLNMMNIHQARHAAAAISGPPSPQQQRPTQSSVIARAPSQQQAANVVSVTGQGPMPIRRQNSRTKMTPQQAAVAMANGMLAANMAAVVNGASGTNKAAMQMAMVAAQQQQLGHGNY